MELELKHLAAYLPYKVKCQYEGIINGKELKAQDKAYSIDKEPFSWDVKPIKGLKVGNLKSIHFNARGWRCYIGIKGGGKAFYNGHNFMLLLRPMCELPDVINQMERDCNHSMSYENGMFSDCMVDNFSIDWIPKKCYEWLIQHHFDVFGLIDKGLAINKALNGK